MIHRRVWRQDRDRPEIRAEILEKRLVACKMLRTRQFGKGLMSVHYLKISLLFTIAVWCCQTLRASPAPFLPEERVTTDNRNYEMTRNPNHAMAVGPDGTVHLVFWDGYLETSPLHPSAVWYCRRDPSGQWLRPEMVDDSFTSPRTRLGGRHPSLLLRPNGEVRVFWHDYRNCSAAHNWIDNIELYMDVRPPSGFFSPNDIRLTNTSASHDGDNGYVPQVVAASSGEIFLAWYDYHLNRNLADIYLMRSDVQGHFNLATTVDTWRLTNFSQRANGISYTLPDIAVDPANTVHLVWTKDIRGGYGVYYARLSVSAPLTTPTLLSATGADFFDPPHIASARNGDIFVVWTEHGIPAGDTNIVAARLRRGANSFDPCFTITQNPANQLHCDLAVDSRGKLAVVWVDERNDRDEIFYGLFDPALKTLLFETKISGETAEAFRPSIEIDQNDQPYIAWMDYRTEQGTIYFRTAARPATVRPTWNLYR